MDHQVRTPVSDSAVRSLITLELHSKRDTAEVKRITAALMRVQIRVNVRLDNAMFVFETNLCI